MKCTKLYRRIQPVSHGTKRSAEYQPPHTRCVPVTPSLSFGFSSAYRLWCDNSFCTGSCEGTEMPHNPWGQPWHLTPSTHVLLVISHPLSNQGNRVRASGRVSTDNSTFCQAICVIWWECSSGKQTWEETGGWRKTTDSSRKRHEGDDVPTARGQATPIQMVCWVSKWALQTAPSLLQNPDHEFVCQQPPRAGGQPDTDWGPRHSRLSISTTQVCYQ